MTSSGVVFGIIISSIYGAAFHFWRGGGLGRIILYLVLSWCGFWAGHFLAGYAEWAFDMVGTLHLGGGTFGSVVFLLIGYWLSLVEVEKK